MTDSLSVVFFYLASATTLAMAVGVVSAKNPLRGALALIATLCSLAWLFVLLDAGFVAAMQILVYAGAIMVLFVLVIMLLNLGPGAGGRPVYLSISKIFGVAAAGYLALRVFTGSQGMSSFSSAPVDGTVKAVGRLLLTDYLFAFEALSVLLLVAVVGAVALGIRRQA